MMAYRDTGATKISWVKSLSRSSRSEMIPSALDWKSTWPRTPTKVKTSRS